MPSRLDRLFILLDQGTTDAVRKAAALQLGEVQKLHPHDFDNLLSKIKIYLRSNSWDTRIAASLAVEAIIKNIPQWSPPGIENPASQELELCQDATLSTQQKIPIVNLKHGELKRRKSEGSMSFAYFNINRVIEHGKNLLASEGSEYDLIDPSGFPETDNSSSLKEKLIKQRALLNKKLGLDVAENLDLGFNSSELFSDKDLQSSAFQTNNSESASQIPDTKCDANILLQFPNKIPSSDHTSKRKLSSGDLNNKKIKLEQDNGDEDSAFGSAAGANEWPLQSFTDELLSDIFSAQWEVRHGSVTALRELLKIHGRSGGRRADAYRYEMETLNQYWLEDIALRLMCVLALDKFGDFVSDQVVAPVRETCAQTLGSIFNIMSVDRVFAAADILLQLLKRPEWETRHGGLLGLKYLLAVRGDLTADLLPKVFDSIFECLKDSVDDVSAVAAAALVPVKDSLIESLPEKVPVIIDFLWDVLIDLDDLTSSTSNILMLLASLSSRCNYEPKKLKEFIPRLWPFIGHSLTSVRKSALESLYTLSTPSVSTNEPVQMPPAVTSIAWLDVGLLSESLRLLYQRSLIENNEEILKLLYRCWHQLITNSSFPELLTASYQHFSSWICLLMHPSRTPIDSRNPRVWYTPACVIGRSGYSEDKLYLAGSETMNESHVKREKLVTRTRLYAARLIGLLARYFAIVPTTESPSPLECFSDILAHHLKTKSAVQRTCVGWIIECWSSNAKQFGDDCSLPDSLIEKCTSCLQESIYYDEVASIFTRMQYDTRDFVSLMKANKMELNEAIYKNNAVYSTTQINDLVTSIYPNSLAKMKNKIRVKTRESFEDKRKTIIANYEELTKLQSSLLITVRASISSCLIAWNILPRPLDLAISSLLESIKKEENEELQRSSALHLTLLLDLCISQSSVEVNWIITELVNFICHDMTCLPLSSSSCSNPSTGVYELKNKSIIDSSAGAPTLHNFADILTLRQMNKLGERPTIRRSNSSNSMKKSASIDGDIDDVSTDDLDRSTELLRKGATFSLVEIVAHFGLSLPQILPQLWSYVTDIENLTQTEINSDQERQLIMCCSVLEVIAPSIHPSLHSDLVKILSGLLHCIKSKSANVRHMGARCIGVLSTVIEKETMDLILGPVIEMLGVRDSDAHRQGSTETIYWVLEKMKINIVPYIVLLIIPMLGRMSDQNDEVRLLATQCFATLIRLMPLDSDTDVNPVLRARKASEYSFLTQLMNPQKIEDYILPIPVNAELRSYQQQGINWLAFLNRYKLHGILSDEMGLGKTLMSICILAANHADRARKWQENGALDCKPLPSLVVCPPTLTGHWVYEVGKFVDPRYLKPLHYTGPPSERTKLRSKLRTHPDELTYNVVIASYDIVRNDIDFFSSIFWNYCILDEGHIIKNGKTKLAKAVKSLSANHRLILTGTPIQNNVLELWSLFDFLIPGFLGTEKQFLMKYSRPIIQSRDGKCSSKEQENGVLAMESLHRQSLPFILRRIKEDVLKDLPPKIMQDHYCELSPLQMSLYEDFAKSRARKSLESSMKSYDLKSTNDGNDASPAHIFQALHYLRKVCNHPKLVLSPSHPEYSSVLGKLKENNSSLDDINQSAKLCALRQLLLDCGIGCQTSNSSNSLIMSSEPIVNQHRALIFCQLKVMLDIVENDLLKANMPNVSYLRLDGSVPAALRHSIVHRFNNDPSIDVLLLTTQVGGLGLNLTGADTVIFVEHDWNPMKDLQAMDRAHRIGQKKVVNVYRLITKGTLEEKIMGLQKFKLTVANTVISSENSALQSMGTDQLLDLFSVDNKELKHGSEDSDKKNVGMKAVLENLPELWDSSQYENEYDLSNFIESLK